MARVRGITQFYLPPTRLSMNGMSHPAFTPFCRASPHFGQYSFPIPPRVAGWVGLGGWLHSLWLKTTYQQRRKTRWAINRPHVRWKRSLKRRRCCQITSRCLLRYRSRTKTVVPVVVRAATITDTALCHTTDTTMLWDTRSMHRRHDVRVLYVSFVVRYILDFLLLMLQGVQKNQATLSRKATALLMPVTLSSAGRLLKFVHHETVGKFVKIPTLRKNE